MEEDYETRSSENGEEESKHEIQDEQKQNVVEEEENVLQFLDSMDSYLTLMDTLSATLRQGWLELASARHSMGVSRINGALFDLKFHPAATTLQVTEHDGGSTVAQPDFTLRKWASPDNGNVEAKLNEDKLQKKSNVSHLRHRGTSHGMEEFSMFINLKLPSILAYNKFVELVTKLNKGTATNFTIAHESEEKCPTNNGSPLTIDNQVQKERFRSLSMFGTLVSPKLRASQLSFETALETLVEVANMRASILSAFDHIQKDMEVSSNDKW